MPKQTSLENLEVKNRRFISVLKKRSEKIQNQFRLFRNLASPNYSYTTVQVDQLLQMLENEIDTLRSTFSRPDNRMIGPDDLSNEVEFHDLDEDNPLSQPDNVFEKVI